jgi:D-arabinose 1-dehydrogenase-like Zn-dependent alcohol dehydrogenase
MTDSYAAIAVATDGSLERVRRPLVDPGPGRVRIRVEACGICHSDGLALQPHDGTAPGRVPGHEIVGRIDAVAEDVRNWQPGDRVGVGFLGGACATAPSAERETRSAAPTSRPPGCPWTAATPSTRMPADQASSPCPKTSTREPPRRWSAPASPSSTPWSRPSAA